MVEYAVMPVADYQDACEAVREKTGDSVLITSGQLGDKIRSISGAEETVEYSQMNPVVGEFVKNVVYDPNDYTSSQIAAYAGQTTDYVKSEPFGAAVDLPGGTLIMADRYSGLTYEQEVEAGANTLYNVVPGEKGAIYTVIADGQAKQAGMLIASGQVRMIKSLTANVRDLGGWACDGGTIRYGRLYRGGEFQSGDLNLFLHQLGIRHELNLRGTTEAEEAPTILRDYVGYTCPEKYVWYNLTDKATWKEIIRCVFDAAIRNDPVYFHCSAGADRTGTVACIIEAILGVGQSDIDKEYELTNFRSGITSDSQARRRDESEWKGLINQIKALTVGTTFRDKVLNWVATMGFTDAEINAFRQAVIDGNPDTIVLQKATYSVTNKLTNATTDNAATTAKQYQPYEANIDADDGYAIDSVTVTMGGVDITEKVFTGTVTAVKFAVALTLANCTSSNHRNATEAGDGYTTIITAIEGYTLEGGTIKVTMGGADITSTAYADGVITIPEVTGKITITAAAVEAVAKTVPVTWLEGTTCTYGVGSACTVSESSSYFTCEPISVEEGKSYTLVLAGKPASGFRFVGIGADGKVTEAISPQNTGTTYVYTPCTGTVAMRIRGYTSNFSNYFSSVTELTVS